MRRAIIYIFGIVTLLSSCAREIEPVSPYLNGNDKTPVLVTVVANVDSKSAGTKAADKEFANGDTFVAYLRHVTWDGNSGDRTSVKADKAPMLVSFVMGTTDMTAFSGTDITPIGTNTALGLTADNSKTTSDLTATPKLYWDDISNTTQDIRETNHYLESFYGYCYNGSPAYDQSGSSISTQLVENTGVLGWTVAEDQNQAGAFQHSDLLWSAEQTPVSYIHAKDSRKGLVIPFTHAMSKVTIVVKCDTQEGFEEDGTKNFGSAEVTLKGVNKTSVLTAPTMTISGFTGSSSVKMQKISSGATAVQTSFSALIAPTLLKADAEFATINGIDGNNYTLYLNDAILNAKDNGNVKNDAWSKQLVAHDATSISPSSAAGYTTENGGITRPGVHYILTATLKKQGITVEAIIKNWDAVNAEGIGTIQFANDVTDKTGGIVDALKTNGFDVYKSATTSFGAKVTSVRWDSDKWVYTPNIYWQNSSDNSYFRALSGAEDDDSDTSVNESLAMSQGRDVLWGTTAAHSGTDAEGAAYSYERGAIINPRTGNVPLEFEHPMSKITVNLETVTGDAAVTLAGAKISIANIYDGGTINLNDGSIATLTASDATPIKNYLAANAESGEPKLSGLVVIPQPLKTFEDDTPREGAIAIYPETNDLYEDFLIPDATTAKTSIGTGTPAYYLISQLTSVPATLFTGDDNDIINEHNGALPGAVSESTVKEPARPYTLVEFNDGKVHQKFTEDQFNTIPDKGRTKEEARPYTLAEFQELVLTEDQFNALPAELRAKKYTAETAAVENVKHQVVDGSGKNPGEEGYVVTYPDGYTPVAEGDVIPDTYYNYVEYKDLRPLLNEAMTEEQYTAYTGDKNKPAVLYSHSEYIALVSITETMFAAIPVELKTKPAINYTEAEVNTYNANLNGAWHVGDVKVPAHYKLEDSSVQPLDNDLKTAGNKIMMYITLADNTCYVIDLATCKDSSDQVIEAWQRGKHYTYTISLAKEQITFRALIKDWEEKTGSGNATLEWD